MTDKQTQLFRTTAKDTAAALRRINAALKAGDYSAIGPDVVQFRRLSARLGEMLGPFAVGHESPVKVGERF